MSTELTILQEGKVPAHIQNAGLANRNEGLITTFDAMARISVKGKMFTLKEPGKDDLILKAGVLPRVILAGYSPAVGLAKTFYLKGFDEDAADAPDCSSSDGIKPDSWVSDPQNPACATCKNNAFGSSVKADGSPGKGKACSDKKRLVVLPALKAENIAIAPLFVMDVPATSLKALSNLGREMDKVSVSMETMIVELSFAEVAHPQLEFTPTGWLEAAQLDAVKLRMPDVVELIERLGATGGGKASEGEAPADEKGGEVDSGKAEEPETIMCPRCKVVEVGSVGELCEGCVKETEKPEKETPAEVEGVPMWWGSKKEVVPTADVGAKIVEGWSPTELKKRTKVQMEADKERTERLTTGTTGPGPEGAGQAEEPAAEKTGEEAGASLGSLMEEWGG